MNILSMNHDMQEMLLDMVALSTESDKSDEKFALFCAYSTATNDKFLASTNF